MLNNITVYVYPTFCLTIHFSLDIRLLVPVGSYEQRCFEHGYIDISLRLCFQFFWIHTQKRNLWLIWQFCFQFLRSAILFSIVAVPFYIPIQGTQRFQFIYILTNSFIHYFLFLLLPFWIVAILIGCGEYPPIFKGYCIFHDVNIVWQNIFFFFYIFG